MKKINPSSYTFERLIKNQYLYVDKTEYLWKMVCDDGGMFLFTRPRRFGKSLTVSTLKALFEGKRELFKGLAIDDKPYDWQPHPVIHIDLSNCCSHTTKELKEFLREELRRNMNDLHIQVNVSSLSVSVAFSRLVNELYNQRGSVVILIDEYDKPLLENLTNGKAAEIRDVLAEFYSTVKKEEAHERFVFLTGVTKFCQVSIFSKLNNLQDITMDAEYATMLGYTQKELEANFSEWITDIEKKQSLPHEDFMAKIKNWYDGFRFEENAETVYNPVSIALFFTKKGKFNNYWFSTGTPTFLLNILKKNNFDFEKALTETVDEISFSVYEVEKIDPLTLLLQTGYLTIKNAVETRGMVKYQLDFPNLEVKNAFNFYLLNAYAEMNKTELSALLNKMLDYLEVGQTCEFIEVLKTFLANIPYDIQLHDEKYYQSIIYVLFLAMNAQIQAEAHTNVGRLDAVAILEHHAYIMEFKMDKPAKNALEQIHKMEYPQRYRHTGKQIHLLGIRFSTKKRQITDWMEEIDK